MGDTDLSTVNGHRYAFYRLVGSDASDDLLVEHGEDAGEIVDLFLTLGSRGAQRYMLENGYRGWRKRSSAITSWSGADDTDGGRYWTLPSDFLKACGRINRDSAIHKANGDQWGREIRYEQRALKGDLYYFEGVEKLWLARGAIPPSPVYLEYHYMHPAWTSSLQDSEIDFPLDARRLIIAEAAFEAKDENWLPGDINLENKIHRARENARTRARRVAHQSMSQRVLLAPVRFGNRW
jgi:hypothetical protein